MKYILTVFLFLFSLPCLAQSFDGVDKEIIPTGRNLGIGTLSPQATLDVNGDTSIESALVLKEISAPSQTAGYGTVYASTDSNLYFLDDSGVSFVLNQTCGGGIANPSGSNKQIQFNNNGLFGASSSFTWDDTNSSFTAGVNASAVGLNTIAMGNGATATPNFTAAIGKSAKAEGFDTLALGYESSANGNYSVAMGYKVKALGTGSIALGSANGTSAGDYAIALGHNASSNGNYSTAIGYTAKARADDATAFGYNAVANGTDSIALGFNVLSEASNSISLGSELNSTGTYSSSFGYTNTANGSYSSALGHFLTANGTGSFVIGKGNSGADRLVNNTDNSLVIGMNSNAATLFIGPSAGAGTTGNIGIATTNPQAQLHVGTGSPEESLGAGDAYITGDLEVDGTVYGVFNGTFYGDGSNLTGVGASSIDELSDGKTVSTSVYLGEGAGNADVAAGSCVGIGYQALYNNTTQDNTAIGYKALYSNTVGEDNLAVGHEALMNNTNGSNNIAIGSNGTLISNTLGSSNIAFGNEALKSNTTGNNNIGIGVSSLNSNTTGYYNIAIGKNALKSNINGIALTAIGNGALFSNISGTFNEAVGDSSLYNNTDGAYNIGIGHKALFNNLSGDYSVAIGAYAGYGTGSLTTNQYNTLIGYYSGYAMNNGANNNTMIGAHSGDSITTGDNNTFIGYNAGQNITTGSSNIIIGANNDAVSATGSNQLDIGDVIYGDLSSGNIGIADSTPSYKLDVNGTFRAFGITDSSDIRLKENIEEISEPVLEKLIQLNGVKYNWIDKEAYGKERQIGFIAQDLEQVFPELVKTADDGYKSVAYGKSTAVLVKAIQELKSEVDLLKTLLCNKAPEEAVCKAMKE